MAEEKPPAAPPAEEPPPVKPAVVPPAAKPPEPAPPAPPAPPAETGAPVAYDLTAPADVLNFTEHWASSDMTLFERRARAENWTNTEAQAQLDNVPRGHKFTRDTFSEQLAADPELGGEHREETEAHVIRALDHFAPKDTKHGADLRRMMNLTGYGNFPAHVAAWAAVGRALAEDNPGTLKPAGVSVEDLPLEDRLYPGKGPGGAPLPVVQSA